MKWCDRCENCHWVCERPHSDRPWLGAHACERPWCIARLQVPLATLGLGRTRRGHSYAKHLRPSTCRDDNFWSALGKVRRYRSPPARGARTA
jgi:hypothetical protein